MSFENLVVSRLVLHEVFTRDANHNAVAPRYGGQLIALPAPAMEAFKMRVADALGNASQSMELAIVDAGPGSAIATAATLLAANDHQFIAASRTFPDRLTQMQAQRKLPGGIVATFDGTAGHPARRIVGVIKAETHSGFRTRDANLGAVEYLNDLFLTPTTKLYKIGVFIEGENQPEPPGGWRAVVYDSLMSSARREGAAHYFYGLFLGCAIPQNSAHLTKRFFEHTREFIRALELTTEAKNDLVTSLYSYLKVDQSPTVEVQVFSNYFTSDLRDGYRNFMAQQQFPLNAVQKDLTEVAAQLKLRRLLFSNSIRLTAPPEAFENHQISIETINGDPEPNGSIPEWTRITIRDRIRDQA